VGDAEAVRLFVQRARAGRPDFALTDANAADVAAICRRLDGLPLALELAAARARLLSPRAILARLERSFDLLRSDARDAEPRHRTLRGAIDWSYTLLGPEEQALFRALSACAGGFTLDAAAALAGGADAVDVLDRVASLCDKSLVVRREQPDGEPRFFLLETIREYAHERLAAAGEAEAVAETHARHYLAHAESVMPLIELGQPGPDELARLGADGENLRAAAAWVLRAAERDPAAQGALALRLASALFWFWYGGGHWLERGQFGEARRFTSAALRVGAVPDPLLRARALMAAGLSAHPQGDFAEARDRFAEAREIARAHGASALEVFATCKLGAAHLMLGDLDAAWACSEEAFARSAAEPPGMLHSFVGVWRAMTAIERGDLATARGIMEANRREGVEWGAPVVVGHSTAILGRVALRGGDRAAAGRFLVAALRVHQQIADGWGLALDLEWLSALAAACGRDDDAARLVGAVDALRERVGIAILAVDRADREAREARARARLGADGYARLHEEGRGLAPREVLAVAEGVAAAAAPAA
jgi:tetratricopeptide (TPR) repeat protein